MLPLRDRRAHHDGMNRLPRAAALHVGEFAVGVAVAYAVLAAAWMLSPTVWLLAVAALLVAAVAIVLELRFGPRATGLIVGMLPTALLAGGLFIALSLVVYRLD